MDPTADRRAAELELVNEVARIATLDLELRPMLQRITDALASKFGWEFVALVTIDSSRQVFFCEALTSTVPTDVFVGYSRPLGSGVVGQVAATGESQLIDDVSGWPNYVETLPGAKSELCVPVRHRGDIVAVLNVESTQRAAFRAQLPLLTIVADQIAGAIASAQQHSELQQRARLMEMMSEVSRQALEATNVTDLLERIVSYIRDRFPLERVAIERCSTVPEPASPDERIVPVRFRDTVIGVLRLQSASAEVFNDANLVAFRAFADQVAGAIRIATVTTELEQNSRALEDANKLLSNAIETLHRISTQDGLTGISNRRHFDEILSIEWRRSARSGAAISLLMLDIDHFKMFNDEHGHQAGDDVLRRVAQTLRDAVQRAADVVARYGGEEFMIMLPETDEPHARRIAESLRERVENTGTITVSIGVATAVPPRDGSGSETLVRRADEALYQAKRQGRNRVV